MQQQIRTYIRGTVTGGAISALTCCTIHVETAEHLLLCPEEGQIEAFCLAMTALEWWLKEADTDLDLADCIVDYVQWQGTVTMEEVV